MSNLRSRGSRLARVLLAASMVVGSVTTLTATSAGALDVEAVVPPPKFLPGDDFEQGGNQIVDDVPGQKFDWENSTATTTVTDDSSIRFASTNDGPLENTAAWKCRVGEPGSFVRSQENLLNSLVNPRGTDHGLYLDIAWRRAGNGSFFDDGASVAVEFNQVTTAPPASDPNNPFNCGHTRTPGDVLVVFNMKERLFSSTDVDIDIYRWNGTDFVDNSPTYPVATNDALGGVNWFGSIDRLLPLPAGGSIGTSLFGEVTLDLDAVLDLGPDVCSVGGQVRMTTRDGQIVPDNFAEGARDWMQATDVRVTNCGTISVDKKDQKGNDVQSATFRVIRDRDGDTVPEPEGDDAPYFVCGPTNVTGDCTVNNLLPGKYYVIENPAPSGYAASNEVVGPITLNAGENITINGLTNVDDDPASDGFLNFRTEWDLQLTPLTADNLVNNPHVFTAHLQKNTGGGLGDAVGEELTFALVGEGSITDINPSANVVDCLTDANGECTITVSSATGGLSTLTASFVEAGVVLTTPVQINKQAEKHWIDYKLEVTPVSTGFPVSSVQQFLVDLDKASSPFLPAPGETIALALTGVGQMLQVNGVNVPAPCVTNGAGQCVVTVTSNVAGVSRLTATFDPALPGQTFTDFGEITWQTPAGGGGDPEDPDYGDDPDDVGDVEDPYGLGGDPGDEPDPYQTDPNSEVAGKNETVGSENPTPAPADPSAGTAGGGDPAVIPAPVKVEGSELPRTGSDRTAPAVVFGLVLIGLGTTAMAAGRRGKAKPA